MLKTNAAEKSLFWDKIKSNQLFFVLSGVFLLFLTTQISIPLEPVPITLQTVGVMLIGLTFERKAAIQSVLAYLGLGALGAPVFANFKAGYLAFLSPTGGYLLGFLAAVFVMTTVRQYFKKENFWSDTLICLLGTATIFVFGLSWLCHFMSVSKAIQSGFVPFIIPGLIKIILLTATVRYIKSGYFFK